MRSNFINYPSGVFAIVTCGLLATLTPAQAALVPNGDFEAPVRPLAPNTYLEVGSRIETAGGEGWTVVGNDAGVNIHHVSAAGLWNRTQFLDLTGSTRSDPISFGGVMSDPLTTVAGQAYQVTFDAMNGSSVYSSSGGPVTGPAFSVEATGGSLVQYGLNPGQAQSLTYTFTAAGTVTTLTFRDLTGFDSNAGWIDNVGISAVPEPTTMLAGALLLLPFGASAIRMMRRRQAA